jgi:hypothetical protein
MKPINITLTALLLSLLATVAPLATPHAADTPSLASGDYYVAADGNDSNPGTILQPFATIEKARLAVQSRIATGMTKDITVVLRHQTKTPDTFVFSLFFL